MPKTPKDHGKEWAPARDELLRPTNQRPYGTKGQP
ncbi:MAG: hypothetical protein QOG88_1603 [Actinomycetota bacterium]|jgi:hypothetical protein|nr:hypothetical protein [Actinomycetota bacterium]